MSEQLRILNPRKALNKAFLKVKPNRTEIECFKANLTQLLDRMNDNESEEFHKNIVSDFLKETYYKQNHFINTKGRNDLVIHNGDKAASTVGVIVEAKKPTNKTEMLKTFAPGDTQEQMISKLNVKAFQELVLYYLRERITHKNIEIKYLIATNINEWFIFDATLFDRLFAQNKNLVKQFTEFEGGRLADTKTDFFYKQIAEPFIAQVKQDIEFTWFNIRDYERPLRNNNPNDDNQLIALFKLLSPEHLLKQPFANDSNSLDKRFYGELLHIIGLTETKEGGKKLIERHKAGQRHTGSLLENAVIQLDSLDKITRIDNPNQYGANLQERLFNVGLELSITWINRILFLKLLEAQLITYHKGDKSYGFLNYEKIQNYDALNKLFFQVLAKQYADRTEQVQKAFEKVPYLNSSLFEPSDIEHQTLFISNLEDEFKIPIYSASVLKDDKGKKRNGEIGTLQYLFEFLSAYDFASEGSEEIQEDNKTLINASVLGLIFEKINGYKDGSFFTPGFITMYMCRETIQKAVVQKFNETKGWNCTDLHGLYDKIEDRNEANKIINDLKICDPAVGSGHFLVSALNELIAIKNDLKILQDRDGKRLKEYHFEVVNDELIVTDEDGLLFEYNPTNKESQRIQETLFHEKQTIIENCLFGVDINPNSVKICRLRLWIELLKNAYYKTSYSSPLSSPPSQGGVPEGGGGYFFNSPEGTTGYSNIPEGAAGSFASPQVASSSIHNLPYLKTFRKELRNHLTPAEAKLWTLLKGKGLDGKKFRRQHSVANYILDFYCPEENLAIELDGQGHFEDTQAVYDQERDLFLLHFGIKVLRFENKWVWDNPQGLIDAVRSEFGKYKQPPRPLGADTPPLQEGELRESCSPQSSPPISGGVPEGGGGYSSLPEGAAGSELASSFNHPGSASHPSSKGGELKKTGAQDAMTSSHPSSKGGELFEPRRLETLPNIDINIKCGNSLISRFALDADLKQALKKSASKWTIDSYKLAVDTYRNAQNKEEKHQMERLINDIKTNFRSEISLNDPKVKRLNTLNGELFTLTNQGQLFELPKKEKAIWNEKVAKITSDTLKLETEIEEIKNNKIYDNAFEWRFEFPEVLNNNGDFVGFDVVIGNPPYGVKFTENERDFYLFNFNVDKVILDSYLLFIEQGFKLAKENNFLTFIVPSTWIYMTQYENFRKTILKTYQINKLIHFRNQIFTDATVETSIIQANKTRVMDISQIEYISKESEKIIDTIKVKQIESLNSFSSSLLIKNDITTQLFNKISKAPKLISISKIVCGLTPYRKGKGNPPQSEENAKERIFDSTFKKDDTYRQYIMGRDFYRYTFQLQEERWISYGNWLAEPRRSAPFDHEKKIIIRQTADKIIAHIDDKRFLNLKNVHNLSIVDKSYNYEFVLGLLNSKLINWWYSLLIPEKGRIFAEVKVINLNKLPIKLTEDDKTIIKIVNNILSIKKQSPAADTTALEAQIDQLVYQLYDLTPEEIAIIEKA